MGEAAMTTAVGWLTDAINTVNRWPIGEQLPELPEDPTWVAIDQSAKELSSEDRVTRQGECLG
jgi:hypothetical protein